MLDVSDDTDDLTPRVMPNRYSAAERVLSCKIALREQLINDHNAGRGRRVLLGKIASRQKWTPHRPEVVRRHVGDRSRRPLRRAKFPSFNVEDVPLIASGHRGTISGTDRFDDGNRFDVGKRLLIEAVDLRVGFVSEFR